MSKLLRANFTRLWKNKAFWICTTLMAVLPLYLTNRDGWERRFYNAGNAFFFCNTLMVIVAAIFIGIFIGTEYSDGMLRNKLVIGHRRSEVYLANFLVCIATVLIMYFVWIITLLLSGGYLLFNKEINYFPTGAKLSMFLFCSVTALIAQTAVFLLISMLVHKKSVGAVIAIAAAIIFLQTASEIDERLNEPKYYSGTLTRTDDNGVEHEIYSSDTRNPRYLTGTKRKIYESAECILPFCQLTLIGNWQQYYHSMNFLNSGQKNLLEHMELFPIYSVCVLVVISAGGIFLFEKKDLK